MSLVIPPGFASAAFVLTGAVGTQPYVTTLGLDISDAGGDFVGVANLAFTAYATNILPITSNLLTLDRVTLSVGQDGPGGSVDSDVAPSPGINTSGTFPPTALSTIARKTTNELGRRGRGRMFLPGITNEANIDQDGTILAPWRATVNTRLSAFVTFLNSGDPGPAIPPVLLHSPPGSSVPTPITALTCSDLVGWIRGRIR